MTVENAVAYFKDFIKCNEDSEIPLPTTEPFELAIEALEKQIPKKPYFGTVHNDTAYYCGGCKNFVGFYDTRIYEYCHNCGQKLDWN